MPRSARVKSESGFYHVIAKGSGGQLLFEGPADYRAFLDLLGRACEKSGVSVIAYCLMSNHVHLLLEDPGDHLSSMMQSLMTGYAQHFNAMGGHIGHVFQQRFKSQPVEDDAYLLQAARYIHNNPAKAGVCAAPDYEWSSYREYVSEASGVADTALLLDMCGGVDGFAVFSAGGNDDGYRFEQRSRISEAEVRSAAARVLDGIAPSDLKGVERRRRNALLCDLWQAGLSVRQIERLTGIGRGTIAKVTRG